MMLRSIFVVFTFFAALGLIVPHVPVFGPVIGIEQAHAAKKKRKSLFDLLFKRRNKNRSKIKVIKPFSGLKRKKKQRSIAQQPSVPKVVVAKKAENAPKILVVGDFIAGGLGKALTNLYASNPDIVVVSKTNASSGIVRDDVVDWPTRTQELIAELKPVAVINLVGMNDRQQMRTSGGRLSKLSAGWLTEYEKRVEAIATAGRADSLPFIWIGLPPVRSGAMSSDYLVFNEIYRAKTETAGGVFVDVWDGFTNAEGKFVSAGPDIKGQIVRLRGSKGINMTRAGKAKLAFYADKALRKLGVVQDAGRFFSSLQIQGAGTQASKPEYDPVGTGKTVVIPLGGSISDGGNSLEGEANFFDAAGVDKSVSYQLVQKGVGLQPRPGRVDAAWGSPVVVEKDSKDAEKKTGDKTSSLILGNEANTSQAATN